MGEAGEGGERDAAGLRGQEALAAIGEEAYIVAGREEIRGLGVLEDRMKGVVLRAGDVGEIDAGTPEVGWVGLVGCVHVVPRSME